MKKFTNKKLLIILTMIISMVAFFTTSSISKEEKKAAETSAVKQQPPEKFPIAGMRYSIETDRKMAQISDVDEHYVVISESTGVNIKNKNQIFSTMISDTIKGNGTFFGYSKGVMLDGGIYHTTNKGKVTTVLSPSGKPVTTMKGTWIVPEFQMGGNRYVMEGTFVNRVIGPGVSKTQYKGEGRLIK